LVAHAKGLPARSRQGFLDIFPDPRVTPPVPAQPEDYLLLADIDGFGDRARAGELDQKERRDDWSDDPFGNDFWGDGADWVEEGDALFAAAGEAFVSGRLSLARQAYRRLLDLFAPAHQGGSGLHAWKLETTNVGEAVARYLRAVYETTPLGERGATLSQEYRKYTALGGRVSLRDIATARQGGLPDLEMFLPAWIDALLAEAAGLSPGHRQRLLAEATVLGQGVDGLADLARRPGAHQARTYLAWIDALAEAGRVGDAAGAAREALTLDNAPAALLARAADRLADLATRRGDPAATVDARCRAWRIDPTRQRLLALVAAGEAAGTLAQTLAAEARHAVSAVSAAAGAAGADRLTCELLLLAGEVDAAAAALTRAARREWSAPTHPGPVVLPCLLVAATAAAPPPAEQTHLGQAFAEIDIDLREPVYLDPDLADADDAEDAWGADDQPPSPAAPLTPLLARRVIANASTEEQRQRWLAIARTAVEERVDFIARTKRRSAYAEVASLVIACAEALASTGADGRGYAASMRKKYPRHVAFRAELDKAVGTSAPLAGAPQGGAVADLTRFEPF
jgi:hypothetical protein